MSKTGYISTTDDGVLAWASNFGEIVDETPELWNLTKEQTTEYVQKTAEYGSRLQAARAPETRGKRNTFLKNESKKQLITLSRKYAQQIGKLVSVTDAQRQQLGITIPDHTRTPVPVPDVEPVIVVKRVKGRTVTIELRQGKSTRGKPAKVKGATIFTYTGPVAPENDDVWKFAANTTRTTVQIPFGPSTTGDTVWITAFWNNSRDESGPATDPPVMVNLPAGGVLPTEAETPKMKAA